MVSFSQLCCSLFKNDTDPESHTMTKEEESSERNVHMYTYRKNTYFVQLAGILGAFAVALGGYGAHVLHHRPDVSDERKRVFDTGNFYHFIHALALLGVPLANKPTFAGIFLLLGVILFCGACYITGITGNEQVAFAAPFGGISFVLGWTCMIL